MAIIKWIIGIIIGIAILDSVIKIREGEYSTLFAIVVLLLVEVIIIKG